MLVDNGKDSLNDKGKLLSIADGDSLAEVTGRESGAKVRSTTELVPVQLLRTGVETTCDCFCISGERLLSKSATE